jgi:hypothetical protein
MWGPRITFLDGSPTPRTLSENLLRSTAEATS